MNIQQEKEFFENHKFKDRKTRYKYYLNTAYWKRKRRECFIYFNGICTKCNKKLDKKFIVHHTNYTNLFNEQVDKDIVLICNICHDKIHDRPATQHAPIKVINKSKQKYKKNKKKDINFYSGNLKPFEVFLKEGFKLTLERDNEYYEIFYSNSNKFVVKNKTKELFRKKTIYSVIRTLILMVKT